MLRFQESLKATNEQDTLLLRLGEGERGKSEGSAVAEVFGTAGARVLMDEHQKQLWPEEEEHEGAGSCGDEKALPRGSRSHITLACAPGVQAVQTGIDLLSILKIEEEKPNPEFHITLEEGQLLGLGQGIRSLFRMGGKTSKTKPVPYTSFPFLDDSDTIEAIKAVHSLFILRGLPGSGKSTIAKKITEKYSGISAVASADDFELIPQVDESEADRSRYDRLDQKIHQWFEEDKKVLVVDDTHHDLKRLDYLFDLARDKDYIVFIVNCRMEESNNFQLLVKNSHWKFSVEMMEQLEPILKKNIIPYYFGWFLVKEDGEKMRRIAMQFLDQLSKNETFLKEFVKYVEWDSSKDFNLQEYFQKTPRMLHCTTKFCNYGKVPNCESYAEAKQVETSRRSSGRFQNLTRYFIGNDANDVVGGEGVQSLAKLSGGGVNRRRRICMEEKVVKNTASMRYRTLLGI
ncbi:2',3'-cyclic-nucleotide 3'-phosphodiesterase-like [Mobula hypostoma]|uniref:2',3'-cyclic-nucleotide 3'-phosphodiesterase-like n=1 Tax=Mobula hypostoma TaxID=723540 RepID=UPI002FC2F9D1